MLQLKNTLRRFLKDTRGANLVDVKSGWVADTDQLTLEWSGVFHHYRID